MTRMTATEAARTFSDVLNRVATGEEVEITRNGAPVAVIGPARVRYVTRARFRELLATAPTPDASFGRDLRAVRDEAGPPGSRWPS